MNDDLENKYKLLHMWGRILLIAVPVILAGKLFIVIDTAPPYVNPEALIVFGTLKSIVVSFANALGIPVVETQLANQFRSSGEIFFNWLSDIFTTAVIFIGLPLGISFTHKAQKLRAQLDANKSSDAKSTQ